MPGTISFSSGGPGGSSNVGFVPASVGVFKWPQPYTGRPTLLPNVRCISITYEEGSSPGSAHFRYVFAPGIIDPSFPSRIEQTIPLSAAGPGILVNDDRVLVYAQLDDGSTQLMFDGWYVVPQVNVDADQEMTTFTCPGAMFRQWDRPLAGAIYRNADQALMGGKDVQTKLPIRFNPEGKRNATSDFSGTDPSEYQVFLGPIYPEDNINGEDIDRWTLFEAALYIIIQGTTPLVGVADTYLQVGDLSYLKNLLSAVVATSDDAGPINMDDPSTFKYEDIYVHDCDVTGEAWPDALMRIIEPQGYSMRWILSADSNGLPIWTFKVFRKDDNVNLKQLFLQQAGTKLNPTRLDPSQTTALDISLERDVHDLANQIWIDAKPKLYEASFVLAPLFKINPGDVGNQDSFKATAGTNRTAGGLAYRSFGFDECGEGHWSQTAGSWVDSGSPGFLDNVLQPTKATGKQYVVRRRPGLNKLIQLNDEGDKIEATLHIASDWGKGAPAVYDGVTGTWQKIWSGEWRLLDDRLGVQLTMTAPNSWDIGTPPNSPTNYPFTFGSVNVIECLNGPIIRTATPTTATIMVKQFWLMLTCTIQGDVDFNVVSNKRTSSPTRFIINRRIDKREQFRQEIVSKYSYFFDPDLATDLDADGNWLFRDDEKNAQDIADGYRRYRESGDFSGTVTIDHVSVSYGLGDKITRINGRNISLRTNLGTPSTESPIYPSVVGITFNLGDGDSPQTTVLELSDRRHEPPPRRGMRTKE
jgi:hypothetical protein